MIGIMANTRNTVSPTPNVKPAQRTYSSRTIYTPHKLSESFSLKDKAHTLPTHHIPSNRKIDAVSTRLSFEVKQQEAAAVHKEQKQRDEPVLATIPRLSHDSTQRQPISHPTKEVKVNGYNPNIQRSATYVAPRRTTTAVSSAIPRRNSYVHGNDGKELLELQEELARRKARRLSKLKRSDDEVLVGTRIDEGHVNYVLMYNMLTGIRVSVSRCTAKPQQTLTDMDFSAAHKMTFDINGNELTPSAKYDFKFKDYAPWVFRHLRELFGINPADYLMSLTNKYVLSELSSSGKSGAFFYYSQDYRFIIKTIHHSEHKWMRRILKRYYEHVKENPNTLLCRFYGLHRVKLPHGRKIHFVVMQNVFPADKDIHETFDLKGSTIGRSISEEEARTNPRAVMKDLNWLEREKHLELGPEKRQMFINQLERDVRLLQELNIMDYSLLVGIHDRSRGNKDNLRENSLWVFQPDAVKEERGLQRIPSKRSGTVGALRKAVVESDPVRVSSSSNKLPNEAAPERFKCAFYADEGGFMSTNEQNQASKELYYLGIIDILTPYNLTKKAEHFFKSLTQDKCGISAVHPQEYGQRFLRFIKGAVKRDKQE
ncbi:uncharacterized protein VTP21DRAFT_3145 [Calcarisporiella thermophila]|uniref:uncharacterized protein n=1 Tax=Calcarisporiella thermophila TaxID=911321 RepID=UPI0037432DF2